MQIKALLMFVPLLLNPVSSLVIPSAQDPCGAVESFARRNDHIQDDLPSGCGQRSEIGHVKPMLFKSQKLEGPSLARPQYHNLNARMPPKKQKGGNIPKTGKPTGGNTGTSAGKDTPAEQTKPQGESSGTQPKPNPESPAEKNTPAEKDTSTEKNTPAEQAKPQGEPSGTQSQPQPGNPAQGQKKQQPDAQPESLALRPKPDVESSDTKSETPGTQKEPGKEADKDGNQSDDSGEKPGESSDKGKEKASDQGEGEFNDEDDVPLDPKRKNKAGSPTRQQDDERTMYNIVTPNPHEAEGRKNIKTGEQSYFRKVGDGFPDDRYSTDNPDFSAVKSHGQEPNVPHSKATKDRPQRLRPGEREEKATTGHDDKNEKGESKNPSRIAF